MQQKRKKKGTTKVRCFNCGKDITKVRCFNYGELGHYATQCPRKKGKEEASESKATPVKADKEGEDENCAMSAHAPLEKRWGDIELS